MVRKFFSLFGKEFGHLHEAALLLATASLGSQILALLRDRMLAGTFGASEVLDVYYAAFRVPDILYVTLASLVSVTVLIPFISGRLAEDKNIETKKFLNAILSFYCLAMVVSGAVLFILAPFLASLVAPGFSPEALDELTGLMRIMLLSPFLLGLSNLFGSITQTMRRFFVYALSPIIYNLGIIVGILFFYPSMGLSGLAWGVVLGALGHWLIQVPTVFLSGFLPVFGSIKSEWAEIKKVIFISLPRTITLASHQIATLVMVAIASVFSAGSIAVFNFSFNLQSVPLAIVGVSYSVAAFPTLSRFFASGDKKNFLEQMSSAFRHIIFWSLLSTVFFIVLRAQIVRTILGSGEFGWEETRLVAASLALFSLSIAAQSLVLLLVRSYYAIGKTKIPFIVNTLSSLSAIFFAFFFMWLFRVWDFGWYFMEALFRVTDLPGTDILVLPLAFSIGMNINLAIFWVLFVRDFGELARDIGRATWQAFAASVFGGFAAYQALSALTLFLDQDTFWGIAGQGVLAGAFGLLAFFALLRLLDNQELKELRRALSKKIFRTQAIVPEPEEL